MNYNPTYNDIHDACVSIVHQIHSFNKYPDCILGLSRGGLIPGVIISHKLNIPFVPVVFKTSESMGDNVNDEYNEYLPTIKESCLLIVDDIADSGHTLLDISDYYRSKQHIVYTAAMYFKESSVYVPDYHKFQIPSDAPWVKFPWENDEGIIYNNLCFYQNI